MLTVVVPGDAITLALQEREQSLYFSGATESVLRRGGLISVRTVANDALGPVGTESNCLFTRGTVPRREMLEKSQQKRVAFEGPLAADVLEALGLRAVTRRLERFELRAGGSAWNVARAKVQIGTPPRDLKLPRLWTNDAITVQLFPDLTPDEVIAEMKMPDGSVAPALFVHRGRWISAFPVFDILGEHFCFPPLTDRYATRRRSSDMHRLGELVAGSVAAFVRRSGAVTVRCERWPVGYSSAFTIRHDYDRPISNADHASLMSLYARRGVKCSMGYLAYELPPQQIRDLVDNGHEVQLHVYESDARQLLIDARILSSLAQCPVRGATIHGGDTSLGFRGDLQFAWLEQAGFSYTETFSVDGYPSPLWRPDALGIPRNSSLVASPMHFSLDISTEPGAHRLGYVVEKTRETLSRGALAVAMNHPDLNRDELVHLVEMLPHDGVWFATLGEICDWERNSKYESVVEQSCDRVTVRFGVPLRHVAVLHVERLGETGFRIEVPADCCGVDVGRDGAVRFYDAMVVAPAVQVPSAKPILRRTVRRGLRQARRATGSASRRIREVIAALRPYPQASVVSRISARVVPDALTAKVKAKRRIVLQRADIEKGEIDFLDVAAGEVPVPEPPVVMAESIVNDLHPIVTEALTAVVRERAGNGARLLDGRSAALAELSAASDKGVHLARWVAKRAAAAKAGDPNLKQEEIAYFLASSGLRVMGVCKVLDALGIGSVELMVDHGTGIGLMPWLLADEIRTFGRFILIEPADRYAGPMDELWTGTDAAAWKRIAVKSEDFIYREPVDVVLFSQMLVRLAQQDRRRLLNDAWNALRPNGLLLVNEVLTERTANSGDPALISGAELFETMGWNGTPKLFRFNGGWHGPEDPTAVSITEIGSTGILVAQKGNGPRSDIHFVPAAGAAVEAVEVTATSGDTQDRASIATLPEGVVLLDSFPDGPSCGWRCRSHIEHWARWFFDRYGGWPAPVEWNVRDRMTGVSSGPLAILPVAPTEEVYLAAIGAKSRNMLRRAARAGYVARRFRTADCLEDMFAINTSKRERGGQPMAEGYLSRPKSSDPRPGEMCTLHDTVAVGCFLKERLVAYCLVAVVGELAVIDRILGHGDHLQGGVMNLLIDGLGQVLRRDYPRVRAVNYLDFGGRPGIGLFKRGTGFEEHVVLLRAPGLGDDEFALTGGGQRQALYSNLTPFDATHFDGKGLAGFVPDVHDHRGSGLRAILRNLALPHDVRALDASDHGARVEGMATPDLLLEFIDGPLEILDPRTDAVAFLQERYGEKAVVRVGQFNRDAPEGPFDLIVLDLNSSAMARDFGTLIEHARQRLKSSGHLVAMFVYDSESSYGGDDPLLNPVNRPMQDNFLNEWFGQVHVTSAIARPVLWTRGYAIHSIVDKWMGSRGVGWMDMERL